MKFIEIECISFLYTSDQICYTCRILRWQQICYTYTFFDGLAYNTCGYFAICVVFFRAPQGRGKIRAMSKMSAGIIC